MLETKLIFLWRLCRNFSITDSF